MNNSGVTVARAVLAALSRFTGATRLYALDLAGCPTELVVERWQGRERLSSGFEWWVDVLSTDAHLPLEPLVGKIPGLLHLEVRQAYQGMDYALYSEFESREALELYASHPLHLQAKEQFHHMLASRVSADYEY